MQDKEFISGYLTSLVNLNSHFYFIRNASNYKYKENKDRKSKQGRPPVNQHRYIYPYFSVSVGLDNMDAVFKMIDFFGFGSMSLVANTVQYRCTDKKNCLILVEYFENKLTGWRKQHIKKFKEIILILLSKEWDLDEVEEKLKLYNEEKKWNTKKELLIKLFEEKCKKCGVLLNL